VGVGAIVGGGILALAGVAFSATGPGAILAFALNGVVAFLTAVSFAELASRFPESGGTYTYARKVLTVETAFGIGWVVWFASVVAAVLYALGFAVFFLPFLDQMLILAGVDPPEWLGGRFALLSYALAAVGLYLWALTRTAGGGGQWATIGKVAVFSVVIVGGLASLIWEAPSMDVLVGRFRPFLTDGGTGLVKAMGFTFIALQGFDLIAAVGGEVRDPERNIPRAMFLSLGTALVIYLPLLFLVVAEGTAGRPVADVARDDPETLIALAAGNFLGPTGYWLVIVAGILSMLSALQANLLAASRFARTMAQDRTLPRRFAALAPGRETPVPAIRLTGAAVALILVAVPDVAAAGAMSGLIFLVSFGLVHGIAYLARTRAEDPSPYQSPLFPLIPVLGGAACMALALFQAVAVPSAGALAALWIATGAILYVTLIGKRARVVDAGSEALYPELLRLRGRTPRILVPIANPASAESLVHMAHSLAPRGISRVLLLSVVREIREWPKEGQPRELADAQAILGGALSQALADGLRPEALVTLNDDPWTEITRVAAQYDCEIVLLGVGSLKEDQLTGPLEQLIARIPGDVVILRAPSRWDLTDARRILVPSGGARFQSSIRARLLGSLCRTGEREVTFLRTVPTAAGPEILRRAQEGLEALGHDEAPGVSSALAVASDDMVAEVTRHAADTDLIILGLQPGRRTRKMFGEKVQEIVRNTTCPLLLISQGR
jgi:amino acid transporter/nucleotide-binding universal stress UspA family protein